MEAPQYIEDFITFLEQWKVPVNLPCHGIQVREIPNPIPLEPYIFHASAQSVIGGTGVRLTYDSFPAHYTFHTSQPTPEHIELADEVERALKTMVVISSNQEFYQAGDWRNQLFRNFWRKRNDPREATQSVRITRLAHFLQPHADYMGIGFLYSFPSGEIIAKALKSGNFFPPQRMINLKAVLPYS